MVLATAEASAPLPSNWSDNALGDFLADTSRSNTRTTKRLSQQQD
jgi:hypothetical protein